MTIECGLCITIIGVLWALSGYLPVMKYGDIPKRLRLSGAIFVVLGTLFLIEALLGW
jgi:Na+-transporting NADH:ubiquinone oxidoreductase subunit NqrE